MRRLFAGVAGVVCLVAGAAGLVLPVIPGWILIFVGLSFIAPRYAVRLRRRFERRLFKQETVRVADWHARFSVHAGFTTKHFPLILKKTDEWLDLSNQDAFKALFWKSHVALERDKASGGRFVFLNQVHGDRVAVLHDAKAYEKDGFYHFLKADGVITNLPRLTLLVLTADCLSVFLCVPSRGRRTADWVGLVHAGWRGTRLGILPKAVKLLCEHSGRGPEDVWASFGPSIGCDQYEVGDEFPDYFRPRALRRVGARWHLDLAGENRAQLLEAGLKTSRIADPRICTVTENCDFYSYRKEKDSAGRIISFITKL